MAHFRFNGFNYSGFVWQWGGIGANIASVSACKAVHSYAVWHFRNCGDATVSPTTANVVRLTNEYDSTKKRLAQIGASMLFQATPIPADWLQFGALGLLALVLVGVGGGAFLLIRAYTDHIKELTKSLSEMGKAMFELSRGLAILNEQSQQLQDAIAKNQAMLIEHGNQSDVRMTMVAVEHKAMIDELRGLRGDLIPRGVR